MKNIYAILIVALSTISIINAQNFKASLGSSLVDEIGKLEINLTPDADITSGFSTFEFFIRLNTTDAAKVESMTVTPNTTDFPNFTSLAFVGTDTQGAEAGFVHYHFSANIGGTAEIETTYIGGTSYLGAEVTIVPVAGEEAGQVDAELVHNINFTPSYISLFGGGTDRFDYAGADASSVFDDVDIETDGNTFIAKQENVALPIKLKSFTAVPFENRDANLDWITATEVNASHFEVERSDDGINFTQIGRVEATGNSTSDQDYKFSDRDVNMERNDVVQYYRIKMVDIDGEYKYSGVRVVNFTRSDIDFTINAFPNPTTDFVQLNLTGLDNTSTDRPTLRIFSNTGELVRSQVLNSDLGKIDMSDLPGSLYHFMIDYKGQQFNEKIVVVK